jgi:hypothetical protein
MGKTFLSLMSFHLVLFKPIMSDFPCLIIFCFSKSFSCNLRPFTVLRCFSKSCYLHYQLLKVASFYGNFCLSISVSSLLSSIIDKIEYCGSFPLIGYICHFCSRAYLSVQTAIWPLCPMSR